jgi:outer membrane protein TolC
LLAGCTTYQAQPLPDRTALADSLAVPVSEANTRLEQIHATHEINPADGLDLTEVAILAVLGNPDLKATRARLEVANAQAFAAGLLPDPQLSASLDKPTGNTAGLVDAWAVGLGFDIVPLITRQARIDAEHGAQHKVHLDILWQEWQVIQQARSLAVRYALENQRIALLQNMRQLYQQRYQHSVKALAEGNVTFDVNGADLTALVDSFSQITQLQQQHNQTRHDLNLLLGLRADVELPLAEPGVETVLERAAIQARLDELPRIRPDLLALKAGYQAQEDRVRAAILAQFPSFSIGITRARDTGGIYTSGFNIGLTLPLFSGNRGAIAIERATREQLAQEYQARLAQTQADVTRLLELQDIIEAQRANLQTYLPRLTQLVERARKAYRRGDIDALAFLNMESTWVNKRLEQIALQQTQWETRIALQTLLALPDAEPIDTTPPASLDTQP